MTRARLAALAVLALTVPLALVACSAAEPANEPAPPEPSLVARLDLIDAAVADWADAETLADAKAAAETARNLVVGPDNPLFGDADGDGVIGGEAGEGIAIDIGLLPGLGGEPALAQAEPVNACVEADVLGGPWDDSAARWATAQDVYDRWTPADNTMPELASHPQRIVGWATLTLALDDADPDALATAHEYAGHAQLHVDVSVAAVEDCGR